MPIVVPRVLFLSRGVLSLHRLLCVTRTGTRVFGRRKCRPYYV